MHERAENEGDRERERLWELVELLDEELLTAQPDWQRVWAAAEELRTLVKAAA